MTWLTDLERLAREAMKDCLAGIDEFGDEAAFNAAWEAALASSHRLDEALTPARVLALIEVAKAAEAQVDDDDYGMSSNLTDALRALRETP